MAREYFCAYYSYLESMKRLSDAEVGRLFRALLKYGMTGTLDNLQGNERFVVDGMTLQIDRDNQKYAEKCEKNRLNGAKSTEANAPERTRTPPNGSERTRTPPKEKEKEKDKDKDKEKKKENIIDANASSAEPENPPHAQEHEQEPVICLPLNDGSEYSVMQKQVDEWSALYPAVDVVQQLRSMKGWLLANPSKKKTRNGVCRFITTWLDKRQNSGGDPGWNNKSSNGNGSQTQSNDYGDFYKLLGIVGGENG